MLTVPTSLGSPNLGPGFWKKNTSANRHSIIAVKFDCDHHLIPVDQQANEGIYVLKGEIDLNYLGKQRLFIHSEGKVQYVWNPWDLLDGLFILL